MVIQTLKSAQELVADNPAYSIHTGDGFIVEVLIGTQQQIAKKLIGNVQFRHFLRVLKKTLKTNFSYRSGAVGVMDIFSGRHITMLINWGHILNLAFIRGLCSYYSVF